MTVLLRDIFEIFVHTWEGIRQQSVVGNFAEFERHFPRDPVVIARGLEACFGLEISICPVDFYKDIEDIAPERRDFLSFHEYLDPNKVYVYVNSHKIDGDPLISMETFRFVLLKELFNAVIRREFRREGRYYPDTVEFPEVMSAFYDWISEKYSVYDFDDEEYSPTVAVENAAELLALMFLVDLPALYRARKALSVKPKDFWGIENANNSNEHDTKAADVKFSLFEYDKYAKEYGVKIRLIVLLIKTDFILKIIEGIKSIVQDIREIFSFFDEPEDINGDK